jgi:hypothetical protein
VHSERRRGKPRSRILYWFRTPPGVKVGRAALDEDAIRLIEEFNPYVEFDWTRILKGQGGPPEARPDDSARRQRPHDTRSAATTDDVSPAEASPIEAMAVEPMTSTGAPFESASESGAVDVAAIEIEQESFAEVVGAASPAPAPDAPTAAHARLGSEGVSRLRGRYAELLARISERVSDPARRDELKSQAERLNPDTWVTAEEVTQGLEQYESVFASLRGVLGHRRRRRRRGNRPPGSAPATSAEGGETDTATEPDAPEEPSADDPSDSGSGQL